MALLTSAVFLAIGFAFRLGDRPDLANLLWAAGTVPALSILIQSMRRGFSWRKLGINALALFSIVGALAARQFLIAIVMGIMLASARTLESYAQRRARKERSTILPCAPKFAYRIEQAQLVRISIHAIRPGDRLAVRSGEVIPVDGTIASATALLDASALTGEAALVERHAGDRILRGTINAGTPFEYLAGATSAESTYY